MSIKELIVLSSWKEQFMHWCFSMEFSLPVKSAVHTQKNSTACSCHIIWFCAQTTPEIHSIFPVSHTACHAWNFYTFFSIFRYFNGQTRVIYFPISNPSALTVQNSWGYELMQKVLAELSIFSSGLSVSSPHALEK